MEEAMKQVFSAGFDVRKNVRIGNMKMDLTSREEHLQFQKRQSIRIQPMKTCMCSIKHCMLKHSDMKWMGFCRTFIRR